MELVGSYTLPNGTREEKQTEGRQTSNRILRNIKGLDEVRTEIKKEAQQGFIVGLDGRHITIRKAFAALNAALQSDGAILAKRWIVIFMAKMRAAGYVWGRDWFLLGWVHDELQSACRTREIADKTAQLCLDSIREAGEYYGMKIRLDGEAKFGRNWAECH